MINDLVQPSNRLYGWKSDSPILRSVGIEAVRTHPAAYSRGVATTVWDLLHDPAYRPLSGEGVVPSGVPGAWTPGTGTRSS